MPPSLLAVLPVAARCRFEQRMTECFAIAISQGFKTIMVTPHIDNAVDAYQWRNYAVSDSPRHASKLHRSGRARISPADMPTAALAWLACHMAACHAALTTAAV
jgi:hypothetical protein